MIDFKLNVDRTDEAHKTEYNTNKPWFYLFFSFCVLLHFFGGINNDTQNDDMAFQNADRLLDSQCSVFDWRCSIYEKLQQDVKTTVQMLRFAGMYHLY